MSAIHEAVECGAKIEATVDYLCDVIKLTRAKLANFQTPNSSWGYLKGQLDLAQDIIKKLSIN